MHFLACSFFGMIARYRHRRKDKPIMFHDAHLHQPRVAFATAMWQTVRLCAGRGWGTCVAVFTAISFVLLVSTAASHRHATSLEDQACSMCSVATHKLAGADLAPVLAQTRALLAYYLPMLAAIRIVAVSPLLLPPICGPPPFFLSCLS